MASEPGTIVRADRLERGRAVSDERDGALACAAVTVTGAAAGKARRADYASTIGLKPAQAMRLMSKGMLAGSIILARRGSSITFFMMRFWSAFDL
jgi:hypothetical protein